MAYNEHLTRRIRSALINTTRVSEKRMFRGVTFMVNGKMCVTVGNDEFMFRIDPEDHESQVRNEGCRTMFMKGREYKGYILVNAEYVKSEDDLNHWLQLALDYNRKILKAKK